MPAGISPDNRTEGRLLVQRGTFLRSPLHQPAMRDLEQRETTFIDSLPNSPFIAAPVDMGSDRLQFDAQFAFGCVDTYRTIIYGPGFADGHGMRFITSHEWNATLDPEIGMGHVYHARNQREDSLDHFTAGLMGPMIAGTADDGSINRFAIVYNNLVAAQIQPEVSVGFFAVQIRWHPNWLYEWEDPEVEGLTEEEVATRAIMAIDRADGVEVSSVYRGAVPGTTLKLMNGSPSTQAQENSAASLDRAASAASFGRAKQTLWRARKRADRNAGIPNLN